ncbi:MAG: hypothetical protein GY952_15475 [Rhodobacteraceae bacterium]|nr:hypothetical protein [Paracoccaceae bacterium]
MLPPPQQPEAKQEKTRPSNMPPQNLWQQLAPYQQKLLAQHWGQLLRRMQPTLVPKMEAPDVDN